MIDEIFKILNQFGHLTYGEDVSQLEHVLQCAELARQDDAPDALIAAALLHDIGQFIDDAGNAAELHGRDARHEVTGAAFLARVFLPDVTEPVRLHVDAKRYLCATEHGYAEGLSSASALSLRLQGGPMTLPEAALFRQQRHFAAAIRLRRYDDLGKRSDFLVPELQTYRPLLQGLSQNLS